MQLAVYGVQDLYLTHGPKLLFQSSLQKTHKFAVESIEQTISGTVQQIPMLMYKYPEMVILLTTSYLN